MSDVSIVYKDLLKAVRRNPFVYKAHMFPMLQFNLECCSLI